MTQVNEETYIDQALNRLSEKAKEYRKLEEGHQECADSCAETARDFEEAARIVESVVQESKDDET